MPNKDDLFISVLKELDKNGVLQELILIGSWCHIFYREYFDGTPQIPLIRTLDIDLLIPNPFESKNRSNVSQILENLDFISVRDYPSGRIKYVHPDLELEFLTPELGRGKGNKPYEFPGLHTNAQGLRFLNLLQSHTITVKLNDLRVNVPEPAAYVLHKFIICNRRTNPDKAIRDIRSAREIGEFLIQNINQRRKLISIFNSLPTSWRKTILKNAQNNSGPLFNFLSDNM